MQKNKKIVVFILLLALIFAITISTIAYFSKKEPAILFDEQILSNYPEPLYKALYQYTQSKEKFADYFNNLDNNDKLLIGGIITDLSESKYTSFKEIEDKLTYIFGSNISVEAQDYYPLKEDEVPFLIYDKETQEYKENEEYPATSFFTNLGNIAVYNYKLKQIKYDKNKAIVEYYGLYKKSDSFFDTLTNTSNIERVLEAEEVMEYPETDEEYLTNIFKTNKEDFFTFEYEFTLKKENYYLTNFKILK